MKKVLRIVVDLSSILSAYMHVVDEEFGVDVEHNGDEYHIPDPQTSLERFQGTVENMDMNPLNFIVVKDPGGLPKCRTSIYPEYKQKDRTAPPEFFEARSTLFDLATEWLKSRGAIIATPKNHTEADDLINEIAKRFENVLVWTRDKDLLAVPADVFLQGKGVVDLNPEKFPVPDQFIPVYRAIVLGDDSDNIGSCKGFGPVTWEKMIAQFGEDSIADLDDMLKNENLEVLQDYVDEFKPFQLILDQQKDLCLYYKVLSFFPVPAHKIKWEGGMLEGESLLVTAENFQEVLAEIETTEFEYSVIDYEADTGAESRVWAEQADITVDVLGQEITGMGLRLNDKNWYFSVDHCDTSNIRLDQLELVLELLWGKKVYAHNASFEQTLTYNHFEAMLPEMSCTLIMSSYVNENDFDNLKHLSKKWLGYSQQTYQETVGDKSGMREISGVDVTGYGIDDVITTDALMRLFSTIMIYENTLDVFHEVEDDALYFTTMCFINGVDFDQEQYDDLKKTNDKNTERSWKILNKMLLDIGWEGGEFKPIKSFNMAAVNRVHTAIHGHPVPNCTAVKAAVREMEDSELAQMIEDKNLKAVNEYFHMHWEPVAEFSVRSPKQMGELLYDWLKCPVRLRNKVTDKMKAKGIRKGNRASNEDAILNAIAYEDTDEVELLKILIEYKGYLTKESLFLDKYPKYVHWKTGKIHANMKQSATTTRRFSCSAPNLQQLPKRAGKEFRNMLKAPEGWTMIALDFTGQELRLAADDSKDPDFLSCYIGDNKKDPHSLTGLKIAVNDGKDWDYDYFVEQNSEGDKEVKGFRADGKRTNFSCQYGGTAYTVAKKLCITEDNAQKYIDARAEAFPVTITRTKQYNKECRKRKYSMTMLGARRHLEGYSHYAAKKESLREAADRLAYSMRIQGSAAEMTKLALGTMIREKLVTLEGPVRPITTLHDEAVLILRNDVLDKSIQPLVDCMCQQYADMIVPLETEPEIGVNFGMLKTVSL